MPEQTTLNVSIRHWIGAMTLEVDFHLTKPWTVLFAPSGTGKTTILRTIAGLTRPKQARIVWNQASSTSDSTRPSLVLTDTTQSRFVPGCQRRLPMVTQDSALFPHLTVSSNVSYGFKRRLGRVSDTPEAQSLLRTLLEICRIEHLASKVPAQLSGGEKQRVALARALGADGLVVLLDEPFAGLDGLLKDTLMRDVKAWLGERQAPVLHVTHDVGEVFAVADEVILLGGGRVIAQGLPEIVLKEERERLFGWLGGSPCD